jgi:hypothetical protein
MQSAQSSEIEGVEHHESIRSDPLPLLLKGVIRLMKYRRLTNNSVVWELKSQSRPIRTDDMIDPSLPAGPAF